MVFLQLIYYFDPFAPIDNYISNLLFNYTWI